MKFGFQLLTTKLQTHLENTPSFLRSRAHHGALGKAVHPVGPPGYLFKPRTSLPASPSPPPSPTATVFRTRMLWVIFTICVGGRVCACVVGALSVQYLDS